jgi:hypothetical protein
MPGRKLQFQPEPTRHLFASRRCRQVVVTDSLSIIRRSSH